VIRQIHRLQQMTVGDLRLEWMKLYGEPTRSRNRDYLWRRLAWRVQELAHGGLNNAAKAKIDELASKSFSRARTPHNGNGVAPAGDHQHQHRAHRDPRLPSPGTVIVRQYKGRELRLSVLDGGYELDGTHYGSLSEAARAATGSRWNGPLFWGLRKRNRKT
ncbi:MAG: DUF2924 domain-containing protein, partial [bacterium]|nr:DUF2924 domain-containing protein [bacterium]